MTFTDKLKTQLGMLPMPEPKFCNYTKEHALGWKDCICSNKERNKLAPEQWRECDRTTEKCSCQYDGRIE